MDNYNIELKAEDLPGARVTDVTIGGVTKRCICIPIDNYIGYCSDGYMTSDGVFKAFNSVKIRLSVYSMKEPKYADTHYLTPNVSKSAFQSMDETTRQRYEKIVGHMRPWKSIEYAGGFPDNNRRKNRDSW